MPFAAGNRRLLVTTAVVLLPVEAIALFGFFTVPFDVGYPAGTNHLWIAYGIVSLYVHYPVLFAMNLWHIESWSRSAFNLTCFVTGYVDLFLLVLVLGLIYRSAKKAIFPLQLHRSF